MINLILLLLLVSISAYSISLDECQQKARLNYPLIKQFGLIEQTRNYSLNNAGKMWVPQVSVSIKASYQSDVTEIPPSLGDILSSLTLRPVTFQSLPRDQYQGQVELSQLLWDGGAIGVQKKMINQSSELEKLQLETQLYALKDRINQLYFGTLLIKEQLLQIDLLQLELDMYIDRVVKLKESGLAEQTKIDQLEIEKLQSELKEVELTSALKSYLQILSAFVGSELNSDDLTKPDVYILQKDNMRPEIGLFDGQVKLFDLQMKSVRTTIQPKLGMFAQGGYGRPALNMFAGGFEPYYIGGVRLTWNLSSFYTLNSEIQKIKLSSERVASQKETFLFNQKLQSVQFLNEFDKLEIQLKKDLKIILLHENIKAAELAKLESGVLTLTDLIREINLTEMAKQQKALHEIQLLMTNYQQKNLYNL